MPKYMTFHPQTFDKRDKRMVRKTVSSHLPTASIPRSLRTANTLRAAPSTYTDPNSVFSSSFICPVQSLCPLYICTYLSHEPRYSKHLSHLHAHIEYPSQSVHSQTIIYYLFSPPTRRRATLKGRLELEVPYFKSNQRVLGNHNCPRDGYTVYQTRFDFAFPVLETFNCLGVQ